MYGSWHQPTNRTNGQTVESFDPPFDLASTDEYADSCAPVLQVTLKQKQAETFLSVYSDRKSI